MGAGCSRRALPSATPGVATARVEANSAWQSQGGGSKAALIERSGNTGRHVPPTRTKKAASNGSGAPRVEEVAEELRKVEKLKQEASLRGTKSLTRIFGPEA